LKSHRELNAHSYDQIPMHKLDDQRAVIARTMQVNEKFAGTRPRGWFGPGLTQTDETLDYLAEARVEYIGDWMLDDEPVTLRTSSRPVVALPYNFGIHDIGMDGAPAPRINARSNFVANASRVLEFDPIARSADYIVRAAAGHAKME